MIHAVEAELESIQTHLQETVTEGIRAQARVEELEEEETMRFSELGHPMQEALKVADKKVAERTDLEALENELDDVHREITGGFHSLGAVGSSPHACRLL